MVLLADFHVKKNRQMILFFFSASKFRLLERNGFRLAKEKGSIRYYSKPGHDKLIRIDYHASKEVPTGTYHAILKAAGIRERD